MSRGSHVAASEITEARDSSRRSPASTGRSLGSTPSSTGPRRTQCEDPVVERGIRHPVAGAGVTAQRHPVPAAEHGAVDDVAVRQARAEVGALPGPASRVPSPSRQRTTSRPATVRSSVRPVGTSADAAATKPAVGGSPERGGEGGVDARGLGVAPGAAQVVGSGWGR